MPEGTRCSQPLGVTFDDQQELVEATGFEPTTAWLQTRCSTN